MSLKPLPGMIKTQAAVFRDPVKKGAKKTTFPPKEMNFLSFFAQLFFSRTSQGQEKKLELLSVLSESRSSGKMEKVEPVSSFAGQEPFGEAAVPLNIITGGEKSDASEAFFFTPSERETKNRGEDSQGVKVLGLYGQDPEERAKEEGKPVGGVSPKGLVLDKIKSEGITVGVKQESEREKRGSFFFVTGEVTSLFPETALRSMMGNQVEKEGYFLLSAKKVTQFSNKPPFVSKRGEFPWGEIDTPSVESRSPNGGNMMPISPDGMGALVEKELAKLITNIPRGEYFSGMEKKTIQPTTADEDVNPLPLGIKEVVFAKEVAGMDELTVAEQKAIPALSEKGESGDKITSSKPMGQQNLEGKFANDMKGTFDLERKTLPEPHRGAPLLFDFNERGNLTPESAGEKDVSFPHLMEQLQSPLLEAIERNTQLVKIALSPPHLGELTVEVKVKQNRVQVTLIAERSSVQQMFCTHVDSLKEALKQQGFFVDGIHVFWQGNYERGSGYFREQRALREEREVRRLGSDFSGSEDNLPSPFFRERGVGSISLFV